MMFKFMAGIGNCSSFASLGFWRGHMRAYKCTAMWVGVAFFNTNAPEGRKAGGLKN